MTQRQYEYSIKDIFDIQIYAENKIPATYRSEGYNNSFGESFTSNEAIKAHFSNAQSVIDKIKNEKPEVLQCEFNDNVCINNFVEKYGSLLFRRHLTPTEKNKIIEISESEGGAISEKLANALYLLLVSPKFTYHLNGLDLPIQDKTYQTLNEYDLLSRLTFFIWGSGPDEYLLEKAKDNLVKAEISEIVDYLFDAPDKQKYLARELAYNWFKMGALREHPNTFEYEGSGVTSSQAQFSLAEQLQSYINWMIEENRPVTELVKSGVMFQNQKTASLYQENIPDLQGNTFTKVESDKDHLQAGVLSHMGLWSLNSSSGQVHVIQRGLWVRNELLCGVPLNAPSGELFDLLNTNLSIKDQVNSLSSSQSCGSCHGQFDHYGKPFEVLTSLGTTRESYSSGEDVMYTSNIEGRTISSVADLSDFIASTKKDELQYCTTKNVLTLLLGDNLFDGDLEAESGEEKLKPNRTGSCFSLNFYESIIDEDENIGLKDLVKKIIVNGINVVSKTVKATN